jgi:hypothetical protein
VVQGVTHGRRHRGSQDPVGKREEGATDRTRAPLPRRARLLSHVGLDVLALDVLFNHFPHAAAQVDTTPWAMAASFILIYCIYDSDYDAWRTMVSLPKLFWRFLESGSVILVTDMAFFIPPASVKGSANG